MRRIVFIFGLAFAQNTNVGIGTASPTHRLHLQSSTLRVENLSGTGTVLAQTDAQGVLGRFPAAPDANSLLRGDGTWGSDGTDWKLLGNVNTNPTTNFVGTTDAQDFRMVVNNQTSWRILAADPGTHWVGRWTTATLNDARISVSAPAGWIAVYGQVTSGDRPAIRSTVGDNTSGPAVAGVNSASDGWGAIGLGSGVAPGTPPNTGGGAYGAGLQSGVTGGYRGANANTRRGGAFAVRNASGTYLWVYAAGYEAGNQRKIYGAGTVSTTVPGQNGDPGYTLFCSEAPEVLFWDQGRFTLSQARQWVEIDPILARHLAPPFSVWLQPWGDVAVRVTEVSEKGFWVEALQPLQDPVEVSFFLQARRKGTPESPFHEERLPAVEPTHFFTPFHPVREYRTPYELYDPKN